MGAGGIAPVRCRADSNGSWRPFRLRAASTTGTSSWFRRRQLAESGDIVVALLGEEATVKRLYIGDDTIELRPENTRHRPITVGPEDELRILGKVVATHHK